MNKYLFLTILFYTGIFSIFSQSPNLKFSHIQLPSKVQTSSIKAIFKDSQGFMWIGTPDGLYKYNGYSFTKFTYNPIDTTSLANTDVSDIKEDKEGRILVAAGNSFCIYSREKNNFKNYNYSLSKSKGLTAKMIKQVLVDKDGRIWLSCETGIIKFIPETESFITYTPEIDTSLHLKGISITCMIEDNKDIIWAGSYGGGLLKFDTFKKEFKRYKKNRHPKSISSNIVNDIAFGADDNLWIATVDGGLCYFNKKTEEFTIYQKDKNDPFAIQNDNIAVVHCDKSGMLWIGDGREKRLSVLPKNSNRFYHFKHNPSDPKSIGFGFVFAIYQDNQGIVWVGNNVLNEYSPMQDKFSPYYYPPEDPQYQEYTKDIIIDYQENLWIATFGQGLKKYTKDYVFVKRLITEDSNDQSVLSNYVTALMQDKKQLLWIGTLKGISIYDIKKERFVKHITNHKDLHHYSIYYFYQDSREIIWIGTQEGITTFNPKTNNWKKVEYEKRGFNFKIRSIIEDKSGNIWFGSYNGLIRYNISSDSFSFYYHNQKKEGTISSNTINHLYIDSEDRLIVSTKGGLNIYKPESDTFKTFDSTNEIEHENVTFALEDSRKNIWFGTSDGIKKFNIQSGEVKKYDADDGASFNQKAIKRQNRKEFIIGGAHRGFYVFHPDSIKNNPYIPPVYLTNFEIFSKPVSIGDDSPISKHISLTDKIILSYKQSVFSFEFAALNYILPDKNQYAYKMPGFDENWIYTDAGKRFATYTNLDPGEYTFRVKASNNDGVWNEEGTSLQITITPPWWKTWWFRISLIVFIVSGSLGFYFWRVSVLKRQKRILEQKVKERTSELREANTALEEQKEEIQQQNDEIVSVNEQLKSRNEEILTINSQIESQKQEIETAYKNSKILSDFGQKLTSTLDFDKINDMIYNYVSSLMDTSAFGIGIYNPKRNIIDFPYFIENGKPIPYFYKDVNNDKSLSAKCFNNKEEIVLNELREDYKNYLSGLPEVNEMRVPESVMHLPLIVEDRAIGVITVNSYQKDAYSKQDIMNLRTLAAYISIALENSKSYRTVRNQNEQIQGSIRYAQTIQQAVLPAKTHLDKYCDNAILFRPKDIVSGDFYWFTTINNGHHVETHGHHHVETHGHHHVETHGRASLLAVVDCTGHGVPGAFMSLIGNMALNDIINMRHIYEPAQILEELDKLIIKMLRQEKTDNHDGMDMALVKIEQDEADNSNKVSSESQATKIYFSGAKRPLYWYRAAQQKLEVISGTRRSIGGVMTSARKKQAFQTVEIEVRPGDCVYLSTDGLVDQCNSRKKKFSGKRLQSILMENATLPMNQQKDVLEGNLDEFQGNFPQRDDITLWGIKF